MRFGIKEQIIMMEHENERMSYSFEPSDESSGAQGYHQTSYDPNYNQNEHKNPKKKNGVGGRMVALLVAVALVASIGGSALTTVINNISRKNEEANAKAKETMSAQTVEPAQDDSQDTATENSSYSLEKSALPKSLSSNDTGKSLTPKEVYAMNVNATVGIATQITTNVWGQVASASASGSGFILTSDGYVVTNNHVVEGATSVTVKLYNGDEYDAEVIGTDEMNDVALLKIDATGLQAVTIGDSDQIEVGEEVIAIGNPLGELTFTMTAGVVSALDREINTDGKPINMLQTDVAINSGNSGGALFDMNGNVIGITSAKYSGSTSSGASIEGISFAIPINDALRVVYDLQQYGHVTGRAYLGVTVKDLDSTTAATYGLPTGPMIQSVEAGGCAEKAGLQQGDIIIAGTAVGRVRVMTNDKGRTVKTAGPSQPVEITGLADVPTPGDEFDAVTDERMARELVEQRRQAAKDAAAKLQQKVTLDNLFARMQEGEMKELPLIVKADVQGSAEAVKASLEKISNEEVRVRVIHTGVGAINESDVLLASTSGAIIVGFNVRADAGAQASIARSNVDIRYYRVIYDAIDEIESAMKGMLAPKYEEVVIGHAEVRMTYKVSAIGTIAGCMVKDGKVTRDAQVRVLRDNIVIHEGEIGSLQRFKDAVKEVTAGYECGMSVVKFNDIKEGDIFECFAMQEIKR